MLFQRLLQALNALHSQQGKWETQRLQLLWDRKLLKLEVWQRHTGLKNWRLAAAPFAIQLLSKLPCQLWDKQKLDSRLQMPQNREEQQAKRREIDVDIHWTDHIKYSAKKHPCFQLSIYSPCAWGPLMRHRHRDECHRLYRLSFTGWYRALLAKDAKQPNQWKEKAGPFWLCLATTSNHESLVSVCSDLQDEKIIVFWKDGCYSCSCEIRFQDVSSAKSSLQSMDHDCFAIFRFTSLFNLAISYALAGSGKDLPIRRTYCPYKSNKRMFPECEQWRSHVSVEFKIHAPVHSSTSSPVMKHKLTK